MGRQSVVLRDANARRLSTYQPTVHMISSAYANIPSSNTTETAKHAYDKNAPTTAQASAVHGPAHVAKSTTSTQPCHKPLNKEKSRANKLTT